MSEERCCSYVGLACVDGSCPGCHSLRGFNCDECWLYRGCVDCAFVDGPECPKSEEAQHDG